MTDNELRAFREGFLVSLADLAAGSLAAVVLVFTAIWLWVYSPLSKAYHDAIRRKPTG